MALSLRSASPFLLLEELSSLKEHTCCQEGDTTATTNAVQTTDVPFGAGSLTSGVPKVGLADGTSYPFTHERARGAKKILTQQEENKLATSLIDLRKQGYTRSKEIIMLMATKMAAKRGYTVIGGCLGERWWKGFLNRNPLISPQPSQNAEQSMESVGLFYKGLLKSLTSNEYGSLTGKPYLVFSADESVFNFDSVNKIVRASNSATGGPRILKEQREQVTVLSCVSAFGESISPMFILKSHSGLMSYGIQEESPGAAALFSPQNLGWTDSDVYLKWFREVFLPSIPSERPALLLVDGQKALVTADFIDEARVNKIIVTCRPGSSANLLHPLNLSLYGPLKEGLTRATVACLERTSSVVDKHNFAKIFNVAWCTAITPERIRDGFRKTGIFPFNPRAFDYSKLAPRRASATATL